MYHFIYSPMQQHITITKKQLENLKKRYKEAVENNEVSFVFLDKEFLTVYAKYVIEYLENKL